MPQDVGIADQQKAGKQNVGMVAKNSSVHNPTWYISLVFSHSHSTSTSLHLMGFIKLNRRGFLQSTTRPHQSTTRPLERATSHIKGTHPPCLFRLMPWENVNR